MLGAVPTVIFSLTGSEIASIAAAESDDPPGNVANASGGTVPARRRRLPGWRISQRRIRLGASVLTGHGERRAGLLCLALLAVMLAVLVSWADLA